MTTGKNSDYADRREDSFLEELVPLVAEHLAAGHARDFDAETGQARFAAWLAAHTQEPASPAKELAGTGTGKHTGRPNPGSHPSWRRTRVTRDHAGRDSSRPPVTPAGAGTGPRRARTGNAGPKPGTIRGGLSKTRRRLPHEPVPGGWRGALTPVAAVLTVLAVVGAMLAGRLAVRELLPASPGATAALEAAMADPGSKGVTAIAFHPAGTILTAADSNGSTYLWDVATGTPAGTLPAAAGTSAAYSVAFSPDGGVLAAASISGLVRLWDVRDPAHPRPLGPPLLPALSGQDVFSVAFSPDGKLLAAAGADGLVWLWDVRDPAHPRPLGEPRLASSGYSVFSVAFSPDGRVLAAADADGLVWLWDVSGPVRPRLQGRPLPTADGNSIDSVAFSPEGRVMAAAGADGLVRLWDPVTGRLIGAPLTADTSRAADDDHAVSEVAFSPDGKLVAAAGTGGLVRLWDMSDPAHPRPLGRPLPTATGNSVNSVAFSPDGTILATGGSNGRTYLWNLTGLIMTMRTRT